MIPSLVVVPSSVQNGKLFFLGVTLTFSLSCSGNHIKETWSLMGEGIGLWTSDREGAFQAEGGTWAKFLKLESEKYIWENIKWPFWGMKVMKENSGRSARKVSWSQDVEDLEPQTKGLRYSFGIYWASALSTVTK